MSCLVLLDPTIDVVFKMLLLREPALLRDMLQGILAQPIGGFDVINPEIHGARVRDRRVIFDIRAALHDGPRVDLEMQRRIPESLASRLVYYAARDYADQLNRGDQYHLLTPTIGITWLTKPLALGLDRFHSVFELRERHTHTRWGDQLALHILQLPHHRTQSPTNRYTASVHRWARFFKARSTAEFRQLASEDPTMSIAHQTLQHLSMDPQARRMARDRADEAKLYEIDMAMTRAAGHTEGQALGELHGRVTMLLKLLEQRFGSPPPSLLAHLQTASPAQLDAWAQRLLSASTVDDVFA